MKNIIEQLINGIAPEGLSVDGSLDLIGTVITALPEGLSVGRKIIGFTEKK